MAEHYPPRRRENRSPMNRFPCEPTLYLYITRIRWGPRRQCRRQPVATTITILMGNTRAKLGLPSITMTTAAAVAAIITVLVVIEV